LHFAKQLDTFQGQLNDLIVGYDFYTAKGDKTAAKACLVALLPLLNIHSSLGFLMFFPL